MSQTMLDSGLPCLARTLHSTVYDYDRFPYCSYKHPLNELNLNTFKALSDHLKWNESFYQNKVVSCQKRCDALSCLRSYFDTSFSLIKSTNSDKSYKSFVTVRFENTYHIQYDYEPVMTVWDLIYQIGGMSGLWLSLSILDIYGFVRFSVEKVPAFVRIIMESLLIWEITFN